MRGRRSGKQPWSQMPSEQIAHHSAHYPFVHTMDAVHPCTNQARSCKPCWGTQHRSKPWQCCQMASWPAVVQMESGYGTSQQVWALAALQHRSMLQGKRKVPYLMLHTHRHARDLAPLNRGLPADTEDGWRGPRSGTGSWQEVGKWRQGGAVVGHQHRWGEVHTYAST